MNNTAVLICPVCSQEMHPSDHTARLRARIATLQDELAAEKAGNEAWQEEGLKIDGEHEAKIRELENKCQLLEEKK
jgi:hypothetical protein